MDTDQKIRAVLGSLLGELVIIEDGYYRRPKIAEMTTAHMADVAFRMRYGSVLDDRPIAEKYPDVPFQTLEEVKRSCALYAHDYASDKGTTLQTTATTGVTRS